MEVILHGRELLDREVCSEVILHGRELIDCSFCREVCPLLKVFSVSTINPFIKDSLSNKNTGTSTMRGNCSLRK